jgi:hypothetical protein
LLSLFVAQGVFSSLKSLAQVFDTESIFFSLLASCFTSFKLGFQIVGFELGLLNSFKLGLLTDLEFGLQGVSALFSAT